MQLIQNTLFALSALLLILAFYMAIRGDWRRMLHLTADATLFLYVGYVGIGPLPAFPMIAVGAAVVAIMLGLSGWLYGTAGRQSSCVLAWAGAIAVTGVTAAYYLGYLK
ncbi:MAG: hypothetical protein ACM3NT_11835 [Methylocystaceae bacterium]